MLAPSTTLNGGAGSKYRSIAALTVREPALITPDPLMESAVTRTSRFSPKLAPFASISPTETAPPATTDAEAPPGTRMLRDILAPNPSPMTLDGTRSFVIGRERCVVVDPGPADETHIEALVRTLEGVTPMAILLTHAHADHLSAAPLFKAKTGATRDSAAAPVWIRCPQDHAKQRQ
mgnify:CR=1 FL=1